MEMDVEKGPILPGEETQAKNNQTKENRMNRVDQPTYRRTEGKAQWEEAAPRNQEWVPESEQEQLKSETPTDRTTEKTQQEKAAHKHHEKREGTPGNTEL